MAWEEKRSDDDVADIEKCAVDEQQQLWVALGG
jgi:hypothetical protein